MGNDFESRLFSLFQRHQALVARTNPVDQSWDNGIFERFRLPVLTAAHAPIHWRYDLDKQRNPLLLERLGINAVFNPGAIEISGKVFLVCRVEGLDRKSFFAVAESENGIDGFRFWDRPVVMPETSDPDVNIYDMRLTQHDDGHIYGLFCTERKDPLASKGDLSSAVAQCGIARTRDLKTWTRLPDLQSRSPQQRNVVLHPEFVDGEYAFYTRPQDGFIDAGSGAGIGWALSESMDPAIIGHETIIDDRQYHTIKESKNGQGPHPFKTKDGWLHIAHGVRTCASGLRYVLYVFMTDLERPWVVTHRPGGYFIAPEGDERVGDVSNVVFCNGAVARKNGELLIYYASSDTRVHVARTTLEKLVDYAKNTPPDPLRSAACVQQRLDMVDRNLAFLQSNPVQIGEGITGSPGMAGSRHSKV